MDGWMDGYMHTVQVCTGELLLQTYHGRNLHPKNEARDMNAYALIILVL